MYGSEIRRKETRTLLIKDLFVAKNRMIRWASQQDYSTRIVVSLTDSVFAIGQVAHAATCQPPVETRLRKTAPCGAVPLHDRIRHGSFPFHWPKVL